jgi:hypothetical protein
MLDTKKKYGKTPDEIMALVDPKVSRATTWVDTQLSAERTRIQKYYDGALPKRQSDGSSSYVSSDVYDGVESMKSQLLEVFAGGHDIVRFKPCERAGRGRCPHRDGIHRRSNLQRERTASTASAISSTTA